jgi:hypothetical protein
MMLSSRVHKKVQTALVLPLFFLGLACAAEPQGPGLNINLAGLETAHGALTTDDAVSIRVKVYDATPQTNGKIIFDSGCIALNRLSFRIAPMPVGDDLSVVLNVYQDDVCEGLTHRAHRGGLLVEEGEDHLYTLSPIQMGAFNGLPYPSKETMSEALGTTCSSDSDCSDVHPAAHCVVDEGLCQLTSLFPLNSGGPRAFHDALSLSDGQVVAVGGVDRATSQGTFKGADVLFETYEPPTNLFSEPLVQKLSDNIVFSMNEVIDMGNGRFASLGGLREFTVSRTGDSLTFEIPLEDFNINSLVYLVDLEDGSSISGTLPTPLFGTQGMRTNAADDIIFAGGAAPHSEGTKVIPTSSVRRCVMDGNTLSLQCETLSSLLSVPRFGHESICLSWAKPSVCEQIVFAGGYNVPKGNMADIYFEGSEGEPVVDSLDSEEEISVPGGWRWVDTGDAILSFGGTTGQLGSPADVLPYRVKIEDGVISLEALDLGDAKEEVFYRTFHRVVVTDTGTVLVIGGLDQNNEATNSVLRFDSDGNFIDEVFMLLPRFGHSATVLQSGPLKGSVLVQGGMILDGSTVEFPMGAEIYGDPGSNP